MDYQISTDLLQRIEAQIKSGMFASRDDVLRGAMDTLERRQRGLLELRQMVEEADADIAAERVGPFEAEEMKRNVRERLQREGIAD